MTSHVFDSINNTKDQNSPITTRSLTCSSIILATLLASTTLTTAQDLTEDDVLKAIVVSAAGSQTDVKNAPASVSVVTSEDIARLPAQDARALLDSVPGVTFNTSGNQKKVQIRGLSERYTLFLIDGKRVNSDPNVFRGNDYDSGWVPVEAIERIEVVRGAMSSLYGSDAIGGVVNIITKKAENEWHGSLTTEVTVQENRKSGDYGRSSFSLSGPIVKDRLFLKTYGSYDIRASDDEDLNPGLQRDGSHLPGFADSDDKFIDGTATWLVNDSNEMDFNVGYSNRKEDLTTLERKSVGVTHRGEYDFGSSELKIYGDQIHNDYGHGNTAGDMQPNTAYNFNADGKVNHELDFLVPHKVTVGAAYKYQEINDKFVLTGSGGSESSVWQAAIFAEDQAAITDRFEMTFGTRFDNHEKFGWNASPRIYGVYDLTDAVTVKGGWSSSFKAPTLLENSPSWYQVSCGGGCYMVGSEDLKPEIGSSFEAGVSYDQDLFSVGLTAFHNDIKDMIPYPPARTSDLATAMTYDNYVGLSSDGNPMFSYENIDQARTMGVEASLSIRPRDDLTITANYTYLDAKAISGVKRPLAYQPEHSANVAMDWQATDKLSLGTKVNFVGKQYTYVPTDGNMANSSKADAYVTADLTGAYEVNDNFTLKAGVLNIADNQIYREESDDFNVDGRRYYFSANLRF
ncbi:TonB-dependent receptor domain-containing protein [uncultured Cohaesibacter sp.]|uniref:TonB-dependent receptor domain-containing protein n=1 Tax=uncultured Cohaesibacter sp. TaxID=1002546 RepID=UPI0029C64395|nr:TonB-dependent receptor [uncultured Cohaesibacter sp.]